MAFPTSRTVPRAPTGGGSSCWQASLYVLPCTNSGHEFATMQWTRCTMQGKARMMGALPACRRWFTATAPCDRRLAGLRELRSSNDLLAAANSTDLLQSRLQEDGYLWFRNLLEREKVLALRRRICAALSDLRWIDEDQASDLGTTASTPPPDSVIVDPHDWPIFDRVQKMEEFHALPHSPSLTHALEAILGEAILMHPRHICRVHFPAQSANRTLPHQDYPYVQGSGKTLTNWCPLGDVPAHMGPLAILVGSNCYGERRLIEASDLSTGSSNAPLTVDVSDIADKCWWGSANFGAGDVLTFTSLTVHMGLHNQSGEVRLSLDCRAQPLSEQVSARALQPNWVRQTWEDIYEQPGWRDDKLKFYWRSLPLDVADERTFDAHAFQNTFDPYNY